MAVVLVTPEKRREIEAAIARARKRPIPIATVMAAVMPDKPMIHLNDRKPGFERPQSEHVVFEGGVRASLSFEEQPAGMVAHLSISTPRPGSAPNPQIVTYIAGLFGMEAPFDHAWLEEFDPGHYAVNVVKLETPGQVGHG